MMTKEEKVPTEERLKELMFMMNNIRNSDKSGSPDEKFIHQIPISIVANSMRRDINYRELMAERGSCSQACQQKR